MKKRPFVLLIGFLLILALAACGGEADPAAVETAESGETEMDEVSQAAAIDEAAPGDNASLSTDYRDALPLEVQLAFGTLQLEETELAITAEQAEALLPYWRVLQSLKQSDNTAVAEINAVVKEIQGGMTGAQIAAIAAMELTEEKMQTMLEEGRLNFGFGRGAGARPEGVTGGGNFGPGGGPGGGFPGGGPGGGQGGGPGGFAGDPNAFATRQAELEASGENPLTAQIERMSSGVVIRLLETKTGQAPAEGFGALGTVFGVISELTGLSEEELGQALAEGQTLDQVLEANGVSAEKARETMREALADVQLPGDQAQTGRDLDAWIDGLLSGSFNAGRQAEE